MYNCEHRGRKRMDKGTRRKSNRRDYNRNGKYFGEIGYRVSIIKTEAEIIINCKPMLYAAFR